MEKEDYNSYCRLVLLFILFFGFFISNILVASADTNFLKPSQQQLEVTGTVTDAQTGDPLPGVNIVVKGTTTGTSTDMDGNYSIEVAPDATLVFSFVGYVAREVPVDARTTINVKLRQSAEELEEVVVVGYGQQQKASVTASISQTTGEDIAEVPTTNVGNALTGRMPGLTTIQTSSQPGESDPQLFLRGVSSLNDTDPLIIIDGVPSDKRSLMQLNAKDIENISILKDASATAVYGVRGANGVVIANTKRGTAGENQISVDQSFGVQIPKTLFEHASGYKWAIAFNEGQVTDGNPQNQLSDRFLNIFKNRSKPLIYPSYQNPMEELIKDYAFQTQSNVSMNGGTENSTYFVSLGYLNRDGIFKTDLGGPQKTYDFSYNRYNLRANLDLSVTPSTEVKFTSFARIGQRREPRAGGFGYRQWANVAEKTNPFAGAGLDHEQYPGKYIVANEDYTPVRPSILPIADIYGQGYQDQTENRFNMNVDIEQNLDAIAKGLKASAKVGYRSGFNEYANLNAANFPEYTPVYRTDAPYNAVPGDSTVVLKKSGSHGTDSWNGSYSASRYIYWEARVNYDRSFGDHNVGGLLLYNQNKDYYPPNNWDYSNIPRAYVGLVSRITYDYDNRYLFEFNVGYNGSENFRKDRRFGLFPAISAGWNVANEPFMQGVGMIDRLKLRGSIGQVGNDKHSGHRFIYIGDEYQRGTGKWIGYNFGVNIPDYTSGARPRSLGNPDITWSTATKYNAGIDLGLFDNRFTLAADYFYEYREDILITRESIPVFLSSVVSLPPVNLGIVENRGFETEVEWRHTVGDFSYNISGNVSYSRNKVIEMDEVPPNEPYQSMEGQPLNTNFGYKALGLYTKEEVEKVNAGELPAPDFISEVKPGYLRYKDMNGDGVINTNDQLPIGNPTVPQVNFAGQLGLRYKGWSFSSTWQGATQVSRQISSFWRETFRTQGHNGILKYQFEDRWTQEKIDQGIEPDFPRMTILDHDYNHRTNSSYWVRDASYLRMKSAELGYTFESPALKDKGIQRLKVFVSGYNLLTFKRPEYKVNDPEKDSQTYGASLSPNVYPLIRLVNLGVNVEF